MDNLLTKSMHPYVGMALAPVPLLVQMAALTESSDGAET